MKLQMIIVKLFFVGALFIISNQNLHLLVAAEREIFLSSYSGWITNIANQVVAVTAYVIRFEWLPK